MWAKQTSEGTFPRSLFLCFPHYYILCRLDLNQPQRWFLGSYSQNPRNSRQLNLLQSLRATLTGCTLGPCVIVHRLGGVKFEDPYASGLLDIVTEDLYNFTPVPSKQEVKVEVAVKSLILQAKMKTRTIGVELLCEPSGARAVEQSGLVLAREVS